MGDKPQVPVPAIKGWFTEGDEPALLGTRCSVCGTPFFPKETVACRNPTCRSTTFEEVALSTTGTLWSYTTAHYKPPPPAVSDDPFVPYTIAAVTLDAEKMTVLGQVPPDVSPEDLRVGMTMKLELGRLYEDDENEYLVWKWRPTGA